MKKYFVIVIFLMSFASLYAQWDLNLSMGLDFKAAPSFRDYVNANFSYGGQQISTFKSAVNFSGEVDYKIQNNFELGIEYSIQMDSYTNTTGAGAYEISYTFHRPSLMAYYVIPGSGYQFKFGGGIGYRYASLNERIISSKSYSASGFGFLARAVGNTQLSKDFYALIGADIRYDMPGEVFSGDQKLRNVIMNENLNLNSISFGLYLGITFTF